jgi:hypothetical protein
VAGRAHSAVRVFLRRLAYVFRFAAPKPCTRSIPETNRLHQARRSSAAGASVGNTVNFVSWYPGLDVPFDNAGNPLAPLIHYLQGHHHVEETFLNGNKIWERATI